MDLMELGAIGELVGGVAVLVTLVYLALQTRRNTAQLQETTRTNRLHAMRGLNDTGHDLRMILFQHPDLLDFYISGLVDYESLDRKNRIRFSLYQSDVMLLFQEAFRRNRDGFIDPEMWAGTERAHDEVLRTPGFKQFWRARKKAFNPSFTDFVDERIRALG